MASSLKSTIPDYTKLDLSYHISKYIHEQNIENNPIDLAKIDSKYYDVCDIMPSNAHITSYQYKVLHLNIQGLNAKFEDFKCLLSQLMDVHIHLDAILLCETFLNDQNAYLYAIPGYTFMYHNRQTMTKGGVAMYIRNTIKFKLREDLGCFYEGEFESICIETCGGKETSSIIGEIYRIPNTNAQESLQRYETVLNQLNKCNKQVIIGTDQNFDYLKIDTDKITGNLFDTFLASDLILTITKPTRVTQNSATLIDNIYVKNINPSLHSGIICTNVSDHFPVFCFMGKQNSISKPKEPLTFKY
jgi:hypothetical protein